MGNTLRSMIHTAFTIALSVALFLGSLGLPVYRHICSMMGEMAIDDPACSMCHEHHQTDSPSIAAPPCCKISRVVLHSDDSLLARHEHTLPIAVATSLTGAQDSGPEVPLPNSRL